MFYTGAAPNQQAIPAVDYFMSKDGGAAKRWVLLGTDYVYPRTTNKILRAYLHSKGVKDTVLMAIDEINANGGVLGKKLEPVVVDPASNWPLFAEKTKQLLGQDKVAVIFGCCTSVSRKSALPVLEEMNGLLFYPVQYDG